MRSQIEKLNAIKKLIEKYQTDIERYDECIKMFKDAGDKEKANFQKGMRKQLIVCKKQLEDIFNK